MLKKNILMRVIAIGSVWSIMPCINQLQLTSRQKTSCNSS